MLVGTDIVEIERIYQASQRQARFARKILSDAEYDLYLSYPVKRQASFLAGRFSAKEAYSKALGTGIGTWLKFSDISILPDDWGAPRLVKGPVVQGVELSISHSREYAVATVVIAQSRAEVKRELELRRQSHD